MPTRLLCPLHAYYKPLHCFYSLLSTLRGTLNVYSLTGHPKMSTCGTYRLVPLYSVAEDIFHGDTTTSYQVH